MYFRFGPVRKNKWDRRNGNTGSDANLANDPGLQNDCHVHKPFSHASNNNELYTNMMTEERLNGGWNFSVFR